MVGDPLDRIRKLMALALHNPNVEEARSAALAAVRLLAEHKITLTLPTPAAPSPQIRTVQEFEEMRRKYREASRASTLDWWSR